MKKSQQLTVRVKGKGDSKQKAFATALSQVQREVLKNTSNVILRIEPLDLQVVDAKENITTEKFLFFFLPRKRQFYEVTLDITVDMTFIDLNGIEFTSK